MKARVLLFVGSLAVACGPPPPANVVSREACPAQLELRGRVVAEDTGAGVAAARVVASGYEPRGRGEWERTGVTLGDGGFRLCVPRGNEVRVTAEHPDFGLQWTNGYWRGHQHMGTPDRPIQLELRRGAVLRGRLRNPDGDPLPDHAVALFVPEIAQVCMMGICRHLTAVTDGNGEFRFERMVLSPEMRIAWGIPDAPGAGQPTGILIEPDTAACVAAAEAGEPVELVAGQRDLDAEFREIMDEAPSEEPDHSRGDE